MNRLRDILSKLAAPDRAWLKNPVLSPLVIGMAVGVFVAGARLPGGFDAFYFLVRPWWPGATMPAWMFFLTGPLSYLPWPLRWQVWMVITVMGCALSAHVLGNRRWWIGLLCFPAVVNLWLGQVEVASIGGAALGYVVCQRRLGPVWLGVAWLALINKPQVGLGLILLFGWWVWRDQGWRALIIASATAASILLITLILWPGWPGDWMVFVLRDNAIPSAVNAAIFPIGLLAWPVALMPLPMERVRRMRLVAAATLLGSPYFASHSPLALILLTDQIIALPLSYVPVIGMLLYDNSGQWSWVIPLGLLLLNAVEAYRDHRRQTQTQIS